MRWEDFKFDYRLLRANISGDLIRIEGLREAVRNLLLPPDWRAQLDRLNRVRAAHGTTALEGNPLSEADVGELIETADEPRGSPAKWSADRLQVRNAGAAQDWVRSRFAPGKRPMSVGDILNLHRMVTTGSDERDNVPGELRRHMVVVGTEALGGVHRGAPVEMLDRLMKAFAEFVNSRRLREGEHPVVRALLAHFFLVTIHPFGDGNGRVSRLVEASLLFEGGYNVYGFYGLSNYFYRNADAYRKLLQASRVRQPFDLTNFVSFGVEGFAEELQGISSFIKTRLNRVMYRESMSRAFNQRESKRRRVLNQREVTLLRFLLDETEPLDPFSPFPSRRVRLADLLHSHFVRAAYRDVTARTFVRELTRLADRGFVRMKRNEEGLELTLDFDVIGRY